MISLKQIRKKYSHNLAKKAKMLMIDIPFFLSSMTRIVLFGAQGLLGSEIFSLCAEDDRFEIIPLGSFNYDLLDPQQVIAAIDEQKPDVVVNAAAFTDVDQAEAPRVRDIVFAVNTEAPRIMAEQCAIKGIRFFQFSTDFVFDGRKGDYREDDPVDPINVYGESKAAAERAILSANPDACILRTARLYGRGGANLVTHFRLLARKHRPITAIADERGNFTWTLDIATALLDLVADKLAGGVYHLVGAEALSPLEVATEIAQRLHSRSELQPIASADLARKAVRPLDTSLQSTKLPLLPGFSESLPLFLQ